MLALMELTATIVLVAITGCAHQKPNPIPDTFTSLDAWQVQASRQIRGWVPLGTSAADAQQIMEGHYFTVSTNYPAFLWCEYSSQSTWNDPVEQDIRVLLYLNDGEVTNEQVTAYLTGP